MTSAGSVWFSGRTWMVKSSTEPVGPGPNVFSAANVAVDARGLHLRISPATAGWTCAEVVAQGTFGYGRYTWTLASDVTGLDANAVLGMFTWSDAPDGAPADENREIDIEISAWGDPGATERGLFSVAGADPRSSPPFTLPRSGRSTHTLDWAPGRVTASSSTPGTAPVSWTATGPRLPVPGGSVAPRVNLWLFQGRPPTAPQHVVVERFGYQPARAAPKS